MNTNRHVQGCSCRKVSVQRCMYVDRGGEHLEVGIAWDNQHPTHYSRPHRFNRLAWKRTCTSNKWFLDAWSQTIRYYKSFHKWSRTIITHSVILAFPHGRAIDMPPTPVATHALQMQMGGHTYCNPNKMFFEIRIRRRGHVSVLDTSNKICSEADSSNIVRFRIRIKDMVCYRIGFKQYGMFQNWFTRCDTFGFHVGVSKFELHGDAYTYSWKVLLVGWVRLRVQEVATHRPSRHGLVVTLALIWFLGVLWELQVGKLPSDSKPIGIAHIQNHMARDPQMSSMTPTHCIWSVLYMTCLVYDLSCIWTVLYMTFCVYVVSCIWPVFYMASLVYDLSCRWAVLYMTCLVYDMSCIRPFLYMFRLVVDLFCIWPVSWCEGQETFGTKKRLLYVWGIAIEFFCIVHAISF